MDNLENDVNFYEDTIDPELLEIIQHDIEVMQQRFGAEVIGNVVRFTTDPEDEDWDEIDYDWHNDEDDWDTVDNNETEDEIEQDQPGYEPLDPPDYSHYNF